MNNKISTIEASIRRKLINGLPGDDPTLHNLKIGSSLKGNSPLRGLNYEEEEKYLPEVIGISPKDVEWRNATKEYWNNISVPVPADGLNPGKLQGKVINFTLKFKTTTEKETFDKLIDFKAKAELASKAEVISGIDDYILWRYCLVYSKVANKYEDVGKSAKILFYIYSKENELKVEHNAFKLRIKANSLFTSILLKEKIVDSVLLMFEQDLSVFEDLKDKHLALEVLLKSKPAAFIRYVEDTNLEIKADIRKALEMHIIHKPSNTDSYYYGENNEVCLGTTLSDTVIYWKSEDSVCKEIVTAIKARLKNL